MKRSRFNRSGGGNQNNGCIWAIPQSLFRGTVGFENWMSKGSGRFGLSLSIVGGLLLTLACIILLFIALCPIELILRSLNEYDMPSPEAAPWLLLLQAIFIAVYLACSSVLVHAGRSLLARQNYVFCLVICLLIAIGLTALCCTSPLGILLGYLILHPEARCQFSLATTEPIQPITFRSTLQLPLQWMRDKTLRWVLVGAVVLYVVLTSISLYLFISRLSLETERRKDEEVSQAAAASLSTVRKLFATSTVDRQLSAAEVAQMKDEFKAFAEDYAQKRGLNDSEAIAVQQLLNAADRKFKLLLDSKLSVGAGSDVYWDKDEAWGIEYDLETFLQEQLPSDLLTRYSFPK